MKQLNHDIMNDQSLNESFKIPRANCMTPTVKRLKQVTHQIQHQEETFHSHQPTVLCSGCGNWYWNVMFFVWNENVYTRASVFTWTSCFLYFQLTPQAAVFIHDNNRHQQQQLSWIFPSFPHPKGEAAKSHGIFFFLFIVNSSVTLCEQ